MESNNIDNQPVVEGDNKEQFVQLFDRLKHVLKETNLRGTKLQSTEYGTDNLPISSDTKFEGLYLGVNDLFLIVHEYENLKEKYLKLETNAESCESSEQSKEKLHHNSNTFLEKITALHIENEKLTNDIQLLTTRNKDHEELQNALQKTIGRLESAIEEKKREVIATADKLSAHDNAAKRTITVLQKQMEASVSEKDSHIIKISKLEADLVELKENHTNQQGNILDQDTELERVKGLLKIKETEHAKVISMNEQFEKDIVKLTKRMKSHKEEMEGQEMKVKWSDNKLKTEIESHTESKKQLFTITNKLQMAKEEGEQIRKNCQEMIERYQGDEEINSVRLRKQLEEEINKVMVVKAQNEELSCQLVEKGKECAEMETTIDDLKEQIKELQQVQTKVKRYENEIVEFKLQVEELSSQLNECFNDVKEHKEQSCEIIQSSQSLTESDVHSEESMNERQSKLHESIIEMEEITTNVLENDLSSKMEILTNDKKVLRDNLDNLSAQLDQKSNTVNEISSELEETRNDLTATKKKNGKFEKEIAKLKKEIKRYEEEIEGQEMKVKWSENKLKTELESHTETKKQLVTITNKLQMAKEEGEQIRNNCQEMIERYQGDEEINSVRLCKELEEESNNKKELEELYLKQTKEHEELGNQVNLARQENEKLTEQLNGQKVLAIAAEAKNEELSCQLLEKGKDCAEMKTAIDDLKEQIKELQQVQAKEKRYEIEVVELKLQVEELSSQLDECLNNIREHQERDVHSKEILNELQSKLHKTIVEKEEIITRFKILETDLLSKIEKFTNDRKILQDNLDNLGFQLDQKVTSVNEISGELEETRNDLKVTKKKNSSQLKDLQRELHQATKKIEHLEAHSSNSIETLSNRSRTSSCNSLEKLQGTESPTYSTTPSGSSSPQSTRKSAMIPPDHHVIQPNQGTECANNVYPSGPRELEIDKKMLVEKICKLQKLHAKKNEKIEFLEDHNSQLTSALQKKAKLIHHYFLRQEPGLIAPEKFDIDKANMSQYSSIMSSVYSAKSTDKAMTLDVSLTINSKLQAVLEDTVLKNITLQENLNTLGMEIAKLQEAGESNPS